MSHYWCSVRRLWKSAVFPSGSITFILLSSRHIKRVEIADGRIWRECHMVDWMHGTHGILIVSLTLCERWTYGPGCDFH